VKVIIEGQQIWFNSRADGHSPDERECLFNVAEASVLKRQNTGCF